MMKASALRTIQIPFALGRIPLRLCCVLPALFAAHFAFAQGLEFSGVLDTKLGLAAGAGESQKISYGAEEYANLRFSARTDNGAAFYGAVNLIALSGSFFNSAAALREASAPPASFLSGGDYYGAALELERLSVTISRDAFDLDLGLIRAAFGFGQVWNPLDFLNPKNPLEPDARPRGVLGAAASFYTAGDGKLSLLAAAPKDPAAEGGGGFLAGLAGKGRAGSADLEGLYVYEAPREGFSAGLHRGGFSLRADLAAQLIAEALWVWDPDAGLSIENLSATAGIDYSFFDGDLYLLAAYLFNGASYTAAGVFSPGGNGKSRDNRHYLYGLARYRFSDYTSAGLAALFHAADRSFSPILTAEHEVFQGFTVSLQAAVPLDQDALTGNGVTGELGPESQGSRFSLTVKGRLRF